MIQNVSTSLTVSVFHRRHRSTIYGKPLHSVAVARCSLSGRSDISRGAQVRRAAVVVKATDDLRSDLILEKIYSWRRFTLEMKQEIKDLKNEIADLKKQNKELKKGKEKIIITDDDGIKQIFDRISETIEYADTSTC